jgi:recombination protein RecA
MANSDKPSRAEVRAKAKKELRDAMAELGGEGFGLPIAEQPVQVLQRISTGSLALDFATGGGVPRGRIIEIFGPESGGKTSLCYSIIGQAQKLGMQAAFVDAEHTYDGEYASKFGVNSGAVWFAQPDYGEQGLAAVKAFADSGEIGLVVVDSVPGLVPQAVLQGEMTDQHVGRQARMMAQALQMIVPVAAQNDCTIVFVNQIRMNIGVMYGNPETTPGGKSLRHNASLRISVRRGQVIGDKDEPVGHSLNTQCVKNKTAPPMRRAELRLMYDNGFDLYGEVADLAPDTGIITKAGSWYSHGDVRIGQGKDAVVEFFKTQPDVYQQVLDKLRAAE